MKECPICHSRFDDTQNFCTKDGNQLRSVEIQAVTQKSEQLKETNPKNNNGCLKKIIIAGVVIIIGLVMLYNYLMNAATYLHVEPNEVLAAKAGGSCKVDIDFDGYIWTINHQPEWIDVDENDKDFEITFTPNQSGQVREGSITIQSGKFLAQVMIKQNAYATIMKASDTSIKFDRSGGSKDITIETDGCSWESEQYPDWITVTKEDATELHIICKRNEDEYRTGTITVREDNACVTIYVTQSGKCNTCHGSGEVSCTSCWGSGGMNLGMYYSSCMWCGGKGKFSCTTCNGTGFRE